MNFLSSEPTNNFAVEDISITNGKITNFKKISSTLYEAKLNLINQGKHEINISTNTFTDLAGNDNNSHSRFTLFFDNIGPIISILGPFPNKSFTNQTNVKLKIEINEKTLGFEKEDVNVLWGSISNFYQYVDGKSFDVEIFHDEEKKNVVWFDTSKFTDESLNPNSPSEYFEWTLDKTPPTLKIIATTFKGDTVKNNSITQEDTLKVFFEFNENVSDFNLEDIKVWGGIIQIFDY